MSKVDALAEFSRSSRRPQGLAKGLAALSKLTRLEVLHVSETEIRIAAARALGVLSGLTELRVAVSTLNDAGLKQLARLSRLQLLDASCCSAITPA